jgi:hypothetical protein
MTIWLIALPVVALGILFSGFEAISPAGLVEDLFNIRSNWGMALTRLGSWLYLIAPGLLYYLLIGRRRGGA